MSRSQSTSAEHVQFHVEGDVMGHVARGDYIVQIGSIHGSVVNIAMPQQAPRIESRPTPIDLRPSTFSGLLGRHDEIQSATASLQSRQPVELYGESGIGKTALIRDLAYQPFATIFPHGVIYISARQKSYNDLAQFLYDIFYESTPPSKPTEAQLQFSLKGRRALILLDDVELTERELAQLTQVIAPDCTFLWATQERNLWGEGQSVALRGLSTEQALRLIEWELQRPLTDSERPDAEEICALLKGHPLQILQTVGLLSEDDYSLAQVVQQLRTTNSSETLEKQIVVNLSEDEREIAMIIATLRGAPFGQEHLVELMDIPDLVTILKNLLRRGVLQAHSPRYSLTGNLAQEIQQEQDLTPWAERVLTYFANWAEAYQRTPERILEEIDALQQILAWAIETERWSQALRLGRAIEGTLALERRWDAWEQVLQWTLLAAQTLGMKPYIAYTMHQLGTCALCLEEIGTAKTFLSNALRLRESLGDEIGAALTRHHLDILTLPPPPPPQSPPSDPPPDPTPQPTSVPTSAPGLMSILAKVGVYGFLAFSIGAFIAAAIFFVGRVLNPDTQPQSPTPQSVPTEIIAVIEPPPTPTPAEVTPTQTKPTATNQTRDVTTPTPTATPEPQIEGISFAPVLDNGIAGSQSYQFKAGVTSIYALVDHNNMAVGMEWTYELRCNDSNIVRDEYTWQGNEPNPFRIVLNDSSNEGTPLPVGECLFNVDIDGDSKGSTNFIIMDKPVIGQITFSESIDPVNPANTFTEGITKIYVIFEYTGLTSFHSWKRVWYLDGQEATQTPLLAWSERETGTLVDALENTESPLTPGNWTLEIYVDNEVLASGSFTIEPAEEPQVVAPCTPPVPVGSVFNDFESPTSWQPGTSFDKSNNRLLAQATAPDGTSFVGQLDYNLPGNFADFSWNCALSGAPKSITARVYGDGSGHYLNILIKDSAGQRWQFPFGFIDHVGWQEMAANLDTTQLVWPAGLFEEGPDRGNVGIDYPISFSGLVLDVIPDNTNGSGTIYIDDLASSIEMKPVEQTITQVPKSPSEPPPPPPPPVEEPEPISISCSPENATINAGESVTLTWDITGVKAIYFGTQGAANEGVAGKESGRSTGSLYQSTVYELRIILPDNSTTYCRMDIQVLPTQPPQQPFITLIPTSHNFGQQEVNTNSSSKPITIRNDGTGTLTISNLKIGGTHPNDFAITSNNCTGRSLSAGQPCTVSVRFKPTTSGSRSAELIVYSNATNNPGKAVLSGTGTEQLLYVCAGVNFTKIDVHDNAEKGTGEMWLDFYAVQPPGPGSEFPTTTKLGDWPDFKPFYLETQDNTSYSMFKQLQFAPIREDVQVSQLDISVSGYEWDGKTENGIDNYMGDVSIPIVDQNGNWVSSGGPYSQLSTCPDGCYTIHYDVYVILVEKEEDCSNGGILK